MEKFAIGSYCFLPKTLIRVWIERNARADHSRCRLIHKMVKQSRGGIFVYSSYFTHQVQGQKETGFKEGAHRDEPCRSFWAFRPLTKFKTLWPLEHLIGMTFLQATTCSSDPLFWDSLGKADSQQVFKGAVSSAPVKVSQLLGVKLRFSPLTAMHMLWVSKRFRACTSVLRGSSSYYKTSLTSSPLASHFCFRAYYGDDLNGILTSVHDRMLHSRSRNCP